MPLLPRHREVGDQPTPDKLNMLARDRSYPVRALPRRRGRRRLRLTHRPPVHAMTLRQRPDRHSLITRVTSDTFELLHSRSLLHTPPPLGTPWQDETESRRERVVEGGATPSQH